jgi:hypothetical protein
VERSDCLECIVSGTLLELPVESLERVVQYSLSAPPPLAMPWIGGLGLIGESVYVSIALAGEPRGPVPACTGVLFKGPRGRFAVQVDEVRTIGAVVPDPGRAPDAPAWPSPPHWLSPARRGTEAVLRLDVGALSAWLFGSPDREAPMDQAS